MTDTFDNGLGYTDGDVDTNRSNNISLNELIDQRYSRRETLRGGTSAAALAVFGGTALAACESDNIADLGPAPTVTAGTAAATSAGRIVTLTGSSPTAGATLSWVQVDATPATAVMLNGANTGTATFLAPSFAAATPLKSALLHRPTARRPMRTRP